jgi:hypothetical protein
MKKILLILNTVYFFLTVEFIQCCNRIYFSNSTVNEKKNRQKEIAHSDPEGITTQQNIYFAHETNIIPALEPLRPVT